MDSGHLLSRITWGVGTLVRINVGIFNTVVKKNHPQDCGIYKCTDTPDILIYLESYPFLACELPKGR